MKKRHTTNTVSVYFHGLAALLLLLFSVSHFTDLIVGDVFHGAINPVFTFLLNLTVFLLAGIMELITAICCWKYRGHDLTNVAILTFISIILWYRWSFHYVGGYRCNCAGIIGKLFHISKSKENMIPIIALILLTISTIPWIIRVTSQLTCGFRPKSPGKATSMVLFLLLACYQNYAAQIIEIHGTYSATRYNPRTGEIYQPPQDGGISREAEFVAILSEKQVRISVTNRMDSTWWAKFVFDGTNSYTMTSYDSHAFLTNSLKPNISAYAAVSPSSYLISAVEDKLGLTVPWLTYGLWPSLVTSNQSGIVEIPLPWLASRQDLFAFGYRWNITPSADGRFVDHLAAIRDQSLDLSDDEELLRPEIRYPTGNLGLRNWLLQKVRIRREIPTGFPGGRYACTKWYQTNGISIPLESDFKYYWKGYPDKPCYEAILKATEIILYDAPQENLLEKSSMPTLVQDYRYRQVQMPRIYEWAEYTNKPGDSFKPTNDPALLARTELYFKKGPRYDYYGPNYRRVVAITLLVTLLVPLPIMLLWRLKKRNKQKAQK